jgi:serine/threonine-protein kinase
VALSRTEEIGRVLAGRYRIIAPIGRGASAQVYLADDVRLRRRVAVKMLHDALADDAAFLRRFQAEARAAAALNHPNVMAVYDWGQETESEVPFLVLEYLAGGSLRAMLDRGEHLTPSQALLVGLEATRALEYAHRRGFVHRDIKPANLLFGEEGRLRIADFGLARALAEAAWTEPQGAVLGTARYASPEQAQGMALTGKADVYSLALVLVEAVTGRVPFTADTTIGTLMARVDKDLHVEDELGPLQAALTRAGRADPDARLDAHDLAVALMAAASTMPRPAPLPLAGAVEPDGPRDDSDPTMLATGSAPVVVADDPGPTTIVEPEPATTAVPTDDDGDADLEVWPFLNVAAAGAASSPPAPAPAPAPVDLDLTMAEPAPTVAAPPPDTSPPAPAPPPVPPGGEPPYAAPARPRRSWRRWALIAFIVVLIVAVGVAAGALIANLTATPTHHIPAVVGLDVGAATDKLEADHWKVDEEHTRRDRTDPGEVLAVDPRPGTSVREGQHVTLVVSDGPTIAAVPTNLVGASVSDATAALAKAGFKTKTAGELNETVPADHVIRLANGTKARLPKGDTVTLVVSNGPPPRTIPDHLVGKSYEEVVGILQGLKLVPHGNGQYSPTVPKGQVMAVEPGAGATVPRGSDVTVTVSNGPPLVTVPDIRKARSLDEAIAMLRRAGLNDGKVSGDASGKPAGTDPPAGTRVPQGSTVNLILRKKG